ncbi:Hsp20/alpha crystallin family protein [Ruegeria marina]|uniref:Molecular chaperone IbpA, HSP20 family n=1 Tax=Ruegeria marina TaxID=639004 RepID=A0A1G7DF85_9RHOB|nr:Hsp20/alpha crystallin family protein [Ruegeria marina]SDE50197.1 Molecular chaperone IbpA, HSP20 family [Ruegeria marina]
MGRRASAPVVHAAAAVPTLDVIDKENEVKLMADLPGLTEKDNDVQVTDSRLTISGEKREEIEEGGKEGERYVSERRFGSFMRRIALPEGIDQDKIDASFRNGVLTVHLPKTPEAQHPARKIEVRGVA